MQFWFPAERLKMLRIGTTNTSPEDVSPNLNNFELCANEDEALGESEIRTFSCTTAGRYFVLLLEQYQYLTLCEVKVSGSIVD